METPARHVAIILDGNRRYAKKRRMNPLSGHDAGMKALQEVIKACPRLGITDLTLYVFSMQNFGRSDLEKKKLFFLFGRACKAILSAKNPDARKVRVRFIGDLERFPGALQTLMRKVEEKSKGYGPYRVNLCVGYGGREEITQAAMRLAKKAKEGLLDPDKITQEIFSQELWLSSTPDIVIRPGGEVRTSNYLPWQSVYSEWFFLDKFWPEFTPKDLEKVLKEFENRERRFGT